MSTACKCNRLWDPTLLHPAIWNPEIAGSSELGVPGATASLWDPVCSPWAQGCPVGSPPPYQESRQESESLQSPNLQAAPVPAWGPSLYSVFQHDSGDSPEAWQGHWAPRAWNRNHTQTCSPSGTSWVSTGHSQTFPTGGTHSKGFVYATHQLPPSLPPHP